jgi:glyoxylase-like metal-dependent hydrolase (beta-lactamase superfamily II)
MDSPEVTPHIYSIPAQPAFYTGPQAPNVFLVHDGGEGALIDSGFGDDKSVQVRLDFVKEHTGIKVRYILLTHHHFDRTIAAANWPSPSARPGTSAAASAPTPSGAAWRSPSMSLACAASTS